MTDRVHIPASGDGEPTSPPNQGGAGKFEQQIRSVPLPDLRMPLAIILGWYEQIPNDELPDEPVRKAFAAVNAALGIPEK